MFLPLLLHAFAVLSDELLLALFGVLQLDFVHLDFHLQIGQSLAKSVGENNPSAGLRFVLSYWWGGENHNQDLEMKHTKAYHWECLYQVSTYICTATAKKRKIQFNNDNAARTLLLPPPPPPPSSLPSPPAPAPPPTTKTMSSNQTSHKPSLVHAARPVQHESPPHERLFLLWPYLKWLCIYAHNFPSARCCFALPLSYAAVQAPVVPIHTTKDRS